MSIDHRPIMGELAMNEMERFASPESAKAGDPTASNDTVVEATDHYFSAVAALREENSRLLGEVSSLRQRKASLQAENEELAAQLQMERTERSRFQTFSVQIGTSLGLVTQICNQVLDKADHAQRGWTLDRASAV